MPKIHFYARGNKLYIYAKYRTHRVRISTGLGDEPNAWEFLKKHYKMFLANKTRALKTYYNLKNPKENQKESQKENQKSKNEFDSLIENLLKEKNTLKYNTKVFYKSIFNEIREFLIAKNINAPKEFSRNHCIDFVCQLKSKNNKNSTIKLKMHIFKHLFKYALELELIPKNPFYIPKLSIEEKDLEEVKPFNLKEVEALINNAKGELKSFLVIAFFTGIRTGELLGLKFEDINFAEKKAYIKRTLSNNGVINSPKTKSSYRAIDLLPIVEKELRNFNGEKEEFLFKSKRRKLINEFKILQKKLKLEPIRRLYDTRHSFASIMLSQGEEALWISKIMLGHSNLNQTFKSYAKYLPQNNTQRAKFLDKLELIS